MALQVNIHEAKTNLSKLLARVSAGEEIVIVRAGKPIARIVPIRERPLQRVPGSVKGKVVISPDFDAPLPKTILEAFEGCWSYWTSFRTTIGTHSTDF